MSTALGGGGNFPYSSVGLFEAYDTEFSALADEITRLLGDAGDVEAGAGDVDRNVKQVAALLSQCDDLMRQMEVEIRSAGAGPQRRALQDQLANCKRRVSGWRSESSRVSDNANRKALLRVSEVEMNPIHDRATRINDRVSRQNEIIAQAHRTVLETEQVGMEISSELSRNRERIESTRAKASEFSAITDSARRLVASMGRRDVQQRLTIYFVIAILVLAVISMIYFASR